jgi:hypothetical protein
MADLNEEDKIRDKQFNVDTMQGMAESDIILQAVEQEISQFASLVFIRGQNTDLEVSSKVEKSGNAMEYNAYLLLKVQERQVVFWEMVRVNYGNTGVLTGFKANLPHNRALEKDKASAGVCSEYRMIKERIKTVINNHGWKFQTAVFKRKAMYPELGK